MSPSVKKNENLPTTCSHPLRIFILALVVQLANSIPNNYRSGLGSETNFDSTSLSFDEKKTPGLHTYQAPIDLTANFNVINEPDTQNRGDAFEKTNRESLFNRENRILISRESEVEDFMNNGYNKGIFTPNKEGIDSTFKSRNDLDHNETPFKGTINARLGESDNDAVAPMDERPMLEEMLRPKIPAECEGKTVCDKTESEYPMELAQQLVRKLKQDNVIMMPPSVDISTRISDSEDTQNLCRSEIRSSPDKAVFVNGNWSYALQTPEFAQNIEHIDCINPDEPCAAVRGITDGPAANETSVCKQQHIERYIHTISSVDGKPGVVLAPLKIPSGCCCHYKN